MEEKEDYLLVLDNGKGEITDFCGEEGGGGGDVFWQGDVYGDG